MAFYTRKLLFNYAVKDIEEKIKKEVPEFFVPERWLWELNTNVPIATRLQDRCIQVFNKQLSLDLLKEIDDIEEKRHYEYLGPEKPPRGYNHSNKYKVSHGRKLAKSNGNGSSIIPYGGGTTRTTSKVTTYKNWGFPNTPEQEMPEFLGMVETEQLKKRCFMDIEDFGEFGQVTHTKDGILIYQDNGADILAVAHLDTVQGEKNCRYFGGDKLYLPQLDDRLGAYLILDVLPIYGLKYDILLTEGEETGNSTAQHFVTDKKYNWMFEIDRSGVDNVMYQFDTMEQRALLKSYDLPVGIGAFTDICYLEHLECWGVNFGCAYYANHSLHANLNTKELTQILPNIIKFIEDNQNIAYEFDETQSNQRWYGSYDYSGSSVWDDWYKEKDWKSKDNRTSSRINRLKEKYCPTCKMNLSTSAANCIFCEDVLEDISLCPVCNSDTCTGLVECQECGIEYHNDPFIDLCNICTHCLAFIYNLEEVYWHKKGQDISEELIETIDYALIENDIINAEVVA